MDATVTIKTIAEKCGVAKSTVSRVLNNSGYVGKETREKIENIMREYNYSPSAMARNLSKQESNAVGVVIPEADNAFFGEVLRGISDVVDENDLERAICQTGAEAHFIKSDVSVTSDVDHVFDTVMKDQGRIDILVNNAAISYRAVFLASDKAAFITGVPISIDGGFTTH